MPDAKSRKAKQPKRADNGRHPIVAESETPDYSRATPRFCLKHLHGEYNVACLDADQRAAFAMALQQRAAMTWHQITLADRHGLGLETMPADRIRCPIPEAFSDTSKFIVLRYSGKLPMVGARTGDTFHVLWIERQFGDVYDHG